MLISTIASEMNAQFVGCDQPLNTVSSDTRALKKGDFFVALKGEHFDAHDYLEDAVTRDIQGALIAEDYYAANKAQINKWGDRLAFIIVSDTRLGLGALSKVWANQFSIPKIAITGSCGKTTVKEMVAAILQEQGEVLATEGNKNNDIGVPLTLLRLRQQHQFAVVELGANHQGEIGYTSSLVEPDVAVITNAAGAHLEGFGSIKGVAKAKAEIFTGLKEKGCAVLNKDDDFFEFWKTKVEGKRQLSFALDAVADLCLSSGEVHGDGSSSLVLRYGQETAKVKMYLLGKHNWINAMAATAIALAIGLSWDSIIKGLKSIHPIAGRMQPFITTKGYLLINDAYNANPFSVKAAIDVLAQYEGQKILVLGDMGELGSQSERLHEEVGAYAKEKDIDRLLTIGKFAQCTAAGFGVFSKVFQHVKPLIEEINLIEDKEITVLVKGSRAARMARVINGLLNKEAA